MKKSENSLHERPKGISILLGGGNLPQDHVFIIEKLDQPVFCADGGWYNALNCNINVAGIAGDFDSVQETELANFKGPIHKIEDQNSTDFEKTLSLFCGDFTICFGFLGGRMDHSLAAFNALAKRKGKTIFLVGEEDSCAICPAELSLTLPVGTRFSVFPLQQTVATSTGLKWNLDGYDLDPLGQISTSNELIADGVSVSIQSGTALVIFPNDVLEDVLEQWPS